MDPLFNPVIHRDDAAFRERAQSAMQQALVRSQLAPALSVVEAITRYPQSAACEGHGDCRLPLAGPRFSADAGKEPRVFGSLALASGLVDALLMEHYQGSAGADPQRLPGHPVRTTRGGAGCGRAAAGTRGCVVGGSGLAEGEPAGRPRFQHRFRIGGAGHHRRRTDARRGLSRPAHLGL
ncbi:hypothetical protein G6F32_014534 [Rhizopus arrhizus]|nr:hypothetical protein G6F32_014534 [Rhizopus arrhizus]